MEGFHYESTVDRAGLTKTIARQLGNIIDAGLKEETVGVVISFRESEGVSCGYVGNKDEYLTTAIETLVVAIARKMDCENNAEMVDWLRYCVRDSVESIITIDKLLGAFKDK